MYCHYNNNKCKRPHKDFSRHRSCFVMEWQLRTVEIGIRPLGCGFAGLVAVWLGAGCL